MFPLARILKVTNRETLSQFAQLRVSEMAGGCPSEAVEGAVSKELEERFRLVRSIGEFCDDEKRLLELVQNEKQPTCFDAFEPVGRMPIAQGLMKTLIVNKLLDAGCSVKIWIGDWSAEQKQKLGGDKKKIKSVGEYMIEVWKAIGMKVDNVEFVWSSEVMIGTRAMEYWPLVLDIARHSDLPRLFRCLGVEGENMAKESVDKGSDDMAKGLSAQQAELSSSDLLYPCMQCASLFLIEADICLLGMDKRNVSVLIQQYCDDFQKDRKPVILSNSILPGLKEGQGEMSRSNADSCIFMEDEEHEVRTKVKRAFCPPNVVENNPCIDLVKYIVLPWCGELEVLRIPEYGGNKTYTSVEDLCSDYTSGALHPGDLKAGLTKSLNKLLQPVRDRFKTDSKAKELYNKVKKYK